MASEYHRGDMDIQEHVSTFALFMGMTKWGSLYISAFLTWMVLWFCTEAGFFAGFITFVVMAVLGTLLLRENKTAAAH
jgi:hypothetical protein